MQQYSRRSILGLVGGIMAGGAIAGLVTPVLSATDPQAKQAAALSIAQHSERFTQNGGDFSWKPHRLDPVEVASVAHAGFRHQGYACGFGAFYSLIGLMGEKYGAPYKDFPFSMMALGKNGIAWGGTCGSLLGAASALALFYPPKELDAILDELFRWYEITAFPIYTPNPGTTKCEGPLPTSIANSTLCHISVSRWCAVSKSDAMSLERSERCARLTADVAAKTMELIHAKLDGTFAPLRKKSEVYAGCTAQGCHGETSKDWQHAGLKARMDCTPCHTGSNAVMDKRKDHTR